jgi:hypothetical protein
MATFNVSGHGHLAPVYSGPQETLNMNGVTWMEVTVGGNAWVLVKSSDPLATNKRVPVTLDW